MVMIKKTKVQLSRDLATGNDYRMKQEPKKSKQSFRSFSFFGEIVYFKALRGEDT